MDMPRYRTLLPAFEELRGERVLVRPYRPDDAEALFEAVMESREHVLPWLPWGAAYEVLDDARNFIVRIQSAWLLREDLTVGLWDVATGRFVGGSGLHSRGWDVPAFEIGYWVRASAQGRGYVTEAVKLLADYAFDTYGARRVCIQCDARNERSAAVARRLGFVEEARLRNVAVAYDGTIRDTLVFALTPADPRWPQ
jgi:RimJ/RimL family protein N-acetyltransferase